MSVLQEPVVEVSKESELYQNKKQEKDNKEEVDNIFMDLESKGYGGFAYYTGERFGFEKKYVSELDESQFKKGSENGVRDLKKNSKLYKTLKPYAEKLNDLTRVGSPFVIHDTLGSNNFKAMHWVEDRLYFTVKDKEQALKTELVLDVNYKEYVGKALDQMD